MTRLRTLLATVAWTLACAAVAVPAARAFVGDGAAKQGPGQLASAARLTSMKNSRTRLRGGRRATVGCRSSLIRRPADCRSAKLRTVRHGTASPRPVLERPRRVTSPSEATESQAVTIAKVLATPCQNANLNPEPENLTLVRAAVLCLINTERARHGEDPLRANAQLEAAAQSHGQEMLSLDYFDHVSPSGLTPVDRIRPTGYIPSSEVGYVIGENLAWGTLTLATPQAIVAAWIASPEHLANILEGKYRDTGVDVEPEVPAKIAEGAPGALYTQEFGVIVH